MTESAFDSSHFMSVSLVRIERKYKIQNTKPKPWYRYEHGKLIGHCNAYIRWCEAVQCSANLLASTLSPL